MLRSVTRSYRPMKALYKVIALSIAAVVAAMSCTRSAPPPSPLPSGLSIFKLLTRARPHASAVTIVIMENRNYDSVIGNMSQAPYINKTLVPASALLTNSHAIGHPSEPNYLELFSGDNQGLTDDSCPHTYDKPNLGSELIAARKSFVGYSESMPSNGFEGCRQDGYARKHNPWVNFTNVPASSNLVYAGFPASPPTVAIIVPNLCNDMHDCSARTGDDWLKANLPPILRWNDAHDGLFILTWDEADPDLDSNHIPTLLIGPTVKPGAYAQKVTHFDVLRTIEDIFKLQCTAGACGATDIAGLWR